VDNAHPLSTLAAAPARSTGARVGPQVVAVASPSPADSARRASASPAPLPLRGRDGAGGHRRVRAHLSPEAGQPGRTGRRHGRAGPPVFRDKTRGKEACGIIGPFSPPTTPPRPPHNPRPPRE